MPCVIVSTVFVFENLNKYTLNKKKGKPTTSLLSASCLLTFSDNSEACFFCTTQLLKVNFPFRSFLSSISPYGAHHSLSKRNVSLLHSLRGQKERYSQKIRL